MAAVDVPQISSKVPLPRAALRPVAAAVWLGGFVALLAGCQQPWLTARNDLARCAATAPTDPDTRAAAAVAAIHLEELPPPETPLDPASRRDVSGDQAGSAQGRRQSAQLSNQAEEVPAAEPEPPTTLTLQDVIQSVYESYPLLEVALRERDIAGGKELAAWGEFDTGLKAYSLSNPMGYYKRYRTAVKLDQPLLGGGDLFAGYKLGRGHFHPYSYDEETNRGGEFSLGIGVGSLVFGGSHVVNPWGQ